VITQEENQMQQHDIKGGQVTAEDAAAFLGVSLKDLVPLLERYGVGRHYEARPGDEFVYNLAELEKIKEDLAAANDGGPPRPE
jgi:hypothetical protein